MAGPLMQLVGVAISDGLARSIIIHLPLPFLFHGFNKGKGNRSRRGDMEERRVVG